MQLSQDIYAAICISLGNNIVFLFSFQTIIIELRQLFCAGIEDSKTGFNYEIKSECRSEELSYLRSFSFLKYLRGLKFCRISYLKTVLES